MTTTTTTNKYEGRPITGQSTESVIKYMLKENTGKPLMDSGGESNRHWQKNQSRDFENEPEATAHEYGITLSLYHYLAERLERDSSAEQLEREFYSWVEDDYKGWGAMNEWVEYRGFSSIFGSDPLSYNTYNGECLLSQTIQAIEFEFNGDAYVLLQVHGGCDVRGGYTDARVFKIPHHESLTHSVSSASVIVDDIIGEWYTDDGYTMYDQRNSGNSLDWDAWFEEYGDSIEEVRGW